MSDQSQRDDDLRGIKAEEILPVKTVGIESLKEANPEVMSPHRKIFRWFARRPTSATRLAILASILPPDISNDKLLKWMQIGPKAELNTSVEDYVLKKYATKDNRDGSIEDHFGYEYPHRNVPSQSELEELHDVLREHWSGELPTVLDPTAGGGTIPFESLRYGLPTVSNELNPVAWLINEVILEYAPSEGSLDDELQVWIDKISSEVEDELEEYFPKRNGVAPNHYFRAYSIKCPSCGKRLPISNRWWFNRRRGVATRPYLEEGNLRFEIVRIPEDVEKSEFDPSKGTAGDGEIECPHCDVVTERDSIVELFKQGDFEFEVCGVQYEEEVEGHKYHSPTEQDRKAIKAAQDGLKTILSWPRF